MYINSHSLWALIKISELNCFKRGYIKSCQYYFRVCMDSRFDGHPVRFQINKYCFWSIVISQIREELKILCNRFHLRSIRCYVIGKRLQGESINCRLRFSCDKIASLLFFLQQHFLFLIADLLNSTCKAQRNGLTIYIIRQQKN